MFPLRLLPACLLLFASTSATAGTPAPVAAGEPTERPPHRYLLTTPTASELLDGGPAFDALAAALSLNIDAMLRDGDTRDAATLRELYGTRLDLALLAGDAAAIERTCRAYLPLLASPADRLLGCTRYPALAGHPSPAQVETRLYQRLSPLPWAVVGDAVIRARAGVAMPGFRASTLGVLRGVIDPSLKADHSIDEETARRIVEARVRLAVVEPMRIPLLAAYDRYITAHQPTHPELWRERAVALEAADLAPVTIAVWDQGIDPSRFDGRRWTNPNERADGHDDDGNGLVDDLHGIGFDADGAATPEPLADFTQMSVLPEAQVRTLVVGKADIEHGVDSAASRAFASYVDHLAPEQLPATMEAMTAFGFRAHGTLMADVAMRGNPAARLLMVRTSNLLWKMPPPVPTAEDQARDGANSRRIVGYLQAHGTRVVNISWGASPADFERLLEANGVVATPDARRTRAAAMFEAWAAPLRAAIRAAPELLFVVAAGNDGRDIAQAGDLTATLALPNVLVVGAADEAGRIARFSNHGEGVRVFAPGVRVSAALPGEGRLEVDGTSIAAPAVTALAGQLFALRPDLTPAQAIALILRGGTRAQEDGPLLIDPRASVALLRAAQRSD